MIQPILCNNKSIATDISVFLNSSESQYDVYLGVALLERVDIDPESLQHKMLVGRLRNAGTKFCVLRETFHHDNRTIKKWANALKSRDINEMVQAFSGRSVSKKRNPELIRYVKQLYRSRETLGKNYREKIIQKTEEVFCISISPSLASDIFKMTKEDDKKINLSCQKRGQKKDVVGHYLEELNSKKNVPVQVSPTFPFLEGGHSKPSGKNVLVQHAGLILFAFYLRFFTSMQRQFICQLLQGAVNIEQSKSLCLKSLKYFSSPVRSILREQRKALDKDATREATIKLYKINNSFLWDGPNNGDLFYFDPHTKEYTGQLKILKGWCGRRHGISKVLNLDCFHTRSGRPCFIQHYSPYYDMRERFFASLAVFDELFDKDKRSGRTFVIDRAIYGLVTLKNFQDDFVITWEKGFKEKGLNPDKKTLSFQKFRQKNNKNDLHIYSFECQEETWKKDEYFRKIIVKATNEKGNQIVVSILCSHPSMDIQDVVWTIFNRWLQENDFKNLDVNYGINQLDSRSHTSYSEKKELFEDRPIDSPEYKETKSTLRKAENKHAKHLLQLHKIEKKKAELILEEGKLEFNLKKAQLIEKNKNVKSQRNKTEVSSIKNELSRVKRKMKKAKERQKELQKKTALIEQNAENAKEKLNDTIRKGSRLQLLIDGSYALLDVRRKAYMDALRINAANIFNSLHEDFRQIHNNYRDDHVRLRMLTRSGGFLSYNSKEIKVSLWLPGSLQPHIIRSLKKFTLGVQKQINAIPSDDAPIIQIELLSGPISQ